MLNGLLIISILISIFMNPMPGSAKSYKYATTTVNIRAKPSTKSKIVGQLYWNEKIKVIKKVNKDWFLVKYKKHKRYISAQYLTSKEAKFILYDSPSDNSFKSYEDADCITDNPQIAQGKLKQKYHLDMKTGIWMIDNRYCIAVGSYYTQKMGTKIDLTLMNDNNTYTVKCIAADSKADKDTVDNHRIHKDGSIVEFIVNTKYLSEKVKLMGDVSFAKRKLRGKITKIKVYV